MFRPKKFTALVPALAVGLLVLSACSGTANASADAGAAASGPAAGHPDWPKSITIGAIPAENAQTMATSMKPIEEIIKKKMGVDVKVFSGTSYSALIEAQKAGKVDLVEYGPLSYYIAQHQGIGLQNMGIVIDTKGSTGGYNSFGYVNSKVTGVTDIKDFAGKKTCFVDPASTSGFLFPSDGLLKVGINPTTGVTPVFAGAHDASLMAVAKGTCEVGFADTGTYDTLVEKGLIKKDDVKQVWESEEIPGSPIAASTTLPQSFRDALEDVILNDANADGLAAAGLCDTAADCQKETGRWGWADPKVADYQIVDDLCKLTKAPSCTNPDPS